MKTLCTLSIVSAFGFFGLLSASPPAPISPLECLARSSTLVVDADITSEDPYATLSEAVVGNLGMTIHCRETLVGTLPAKDLTLIVSRIDAPKEGWPAYLHAGHRCVFFLRAVGGSLAATDLYFSEQPYSLPLAHAIRELRATATTPPPNNALQRTQAGGGIGSEFKP